MIVVFMFSFVNVPSKKANEGDGDLVYVIPVEREVERGLEAFLDRATTEAMEANADYIIFEIDTPGGRVDAAGYIATILQNVSIPMISFVVNEALSAGSYIALNTDEIYMAPHATMGASEVINQDGTAADRKAQSAWLAKMREAAESKGRDPLYAMAMADANIDLPDLHAEKGELLTLGATDAVAVDYAEGIVHNREQLLEELGLSQARVEEVKPSGAEEVARFITSPLVIPILLSIASLGLIVELYSPGFGVAGTMGLIALALFFYGHIISGLAGLEAIILLILGIVFIALEFFISGGILGILGVGSIVGSLFMAGYDLGVMIISIAIALVVAIVAAIILYYSIGMEKGLFRRLVLQDRTMTELGYVSSTDRSGLLGLTGKAITPLRPAGTAIIDDERIDVVSEGGFVAEGQEVEVVKVQGMRVVVRKL